MEFLELLTSVDGIFSRESSLIEVHKAVRGLRVFDRELSDGGVVDYSGAGSWSVRVFQNPVSYLLRRVVRWNGYNRVAVPDEISLAGFIKYISLWQSQQALGGEVLIGLNAFFSSLDSRGDLHYFHGFLLHGDRHAEVYGHLRHPGVELEVRVRLLGAFQSVAI